MLLVIVKNLKRLHSGIKPSLYVLNRKHLALHILRLQIVHVMIFIYGKGKALIQDLLQANSTWHQKADVACLPNMIHA